LSDAGSKSFFPLTTGADPNFPNDGSIEVQFPTNLLGKYLTALAIDPSGNTSEFSFDAPVGPLTPHLIMTSLITSPTFEGPQRFTVIGSDFVRGATILLNGIPVPTEFISEDQLNGQAPAGVLEEGIDQLSVVEPGPGGATLNTLTFTVKDAPLTL